jgi:hypothetical protein
MGWVGGGGGEDNNMKPIVFIVLKVGLVWAP